MSNSSLITREKIERTIYLIRDEKVMLDRDLARLYDVSTAALNQAVRRNRDRFPGDFMFQLTTKEVAQLNRSQIVIGSEKHRDPRFRPNAFTEQGVAMLSTVLRSKRAIAVNIEIMTKPEAKILDTAKASKIPKAVPMIPSLIDSFKTRAVTELAVAPNAIRIPISLVR